jgi:uncharacterized membrane protein
VSGPRDHDAARRERILRRATIYVYGFLAAALIVAVGGAALVAMLFARQGFPFVKTWIVLSLVILVPSGIALVSRAVRERQEP